MPYPGTLDRDDPVDFARHLYSQLTALVPDDLSNHAPEDYVAYQMALAALRRERPELATVGVGHPLTDLDEAAHAYADEAFKAGIHFGIAAAELHRSLRAMGAMGGTQRRASTPPPTVAP